METLEQSMREYDLAPKPEQERSRWGNLVNGFTSPILGGLVSGFTTIWAIPATWGLVYQAMESPRNYESFVGQVFNCGANFFTAGVVATTSLTFSVIIANMGVGYGLLERERFRAKSHYQKATLENDVEAMRALENKYDYLSDWAQAHVLSD